MLHKAFGWMLRQFLRAARTEKLNAFQRAVPFGDLVDDRWEKAQDLGFGQGTSIYDSAMVFGQPKVGTGVWIGPNVILDATGGLEIGDGCNISSGVQIYSHDSVRRCLSGGSAPIELKPVSIGARTYIGPNVVIAKGVTIGSECIIGANSFVAGDIEDGWLAAGNPCRPIRRSDGGKGL